MSIWDAVFGLTETYINTQTQPMFDIETMPDIVTAATQRSLAWGTDRFDEYIREVQKGFHSQIDRAYKLAQDTPRSVGTPQLSSHSVWKFKQEIWDIMDIEYGANSILKFDLYGPLHPLFFGFHKLFTEYGYDISTNQVAHYSSLVGRTCFLTDMVAHYDVASLDGVPADYQRGINLSPKNGFAPSRPYGGDTYAPPRTPVTGQGTYGVEIFYEWQSADKTIQTASEFIDLTLYKEKQFAQCFVTELEGASSYTVSAEDGNIYPWLYEMGTGTYPVLDELLRFGTTHGNEYFPFIVFREDKENYSDENESPYTATNYVPKAEKLLKTMGIDYKTINDQIHGNPDIADIEAAALVLAVPAESDNQADLEYLHKFFKYFHTELYGGSDEIILNGLSSNRDSAKTGHLRWNDESFDLGIKFVDIQHYHKAGTVADVGEYALLTGTVSSELLLRNNTVNADTLEYLTQVAEIPTVSYCYQALPGLYTEIKVVGLNGYFPVGSREDTYLTSQEQCVIPINITIARELHWSVRNELYTRNFRFIFNSRIVERLEWYQTDIFKLFMGMVAVVSVVIGVGSVIATIGQIVTASSITAALSIAGNFIAQIIILKVLGIVLVEVLGPEYAFILSAVFLATGMAGFLGAELPGLLEPNMLIGMVSSIQAATQSDLKQLFNEYNEEYQSFLEDSNSKLQELEDLKKELDLDLLDSPFKDRFTAPLNLPDESPEQYFNRTIHTGNVGTMAFKTVENFITSSLTLSGIERDPRIEVKVYG